MDALQLINYVLSATLILLCVVTIYGALSPGVPYAGAALLTLVVFGVVVAFERATGVA